MSGRWFDSAGPITTSPQNPQYILTLNSTQTVTLNLQSEVDNVLFLVNLETDAVIKNDDSGSGTNARIQ